MVKESMLNPSEMKHTRMMAGPAGRPPVPPPGLHLFCGTSEREEEKRTISAQDKHYSDPSVLSETEKSAMMTLLHRDVLTVLSYSR